VAVFVDTSAFYVLLDPDAVNRPVAEKVIADLRRRDETLFTHQYVVMETFTLLQRRIGLEAARRFDEHVLAPVEVIWVDRDLHREARSTLLAAGRRGISLVDWTSFLVMRRHGITTAFTFDADFATQGFEVVPELA
jgi:uncharacterized protein